MFQKIRSAGGYFSLGGVRGKGKTVLLSAFFLLIFFTAVAAAVFIFAVRGEEQVLVPDVTGKNLTAALLELQAKELYPRIQMRNSNGEQYLILEQEPAAGTIAKAGRRIRLVVSE